MSTGFVYIVFGMLMFAIQGLAFRKGKAGVIVSGVGILLFSVLVLGVLALAVALNPPRLIFL